MKTLFIKNINDLKFQQPKSGDFVSVFYNSEYLICSTTYCENVLVEIIHTILNQRKTYNFDKPKDAVYIQCPNKFKEIKDLRKV